MKSKWIVKEWKTKKGLLAVVMKTPMGHLCGYIVIPKTNPLYGKSYMEHLECLVPLYIKAKKGKIGKRGIIPVFFNNGETASMDVVFNVHGGVTWADNHSEYGNKYLIGFDTAHAGDNPSICDLDYCVKECENLASQIRQVK